MKLDEKTAQDRMALYRQAQSKRDVSAHMAVGVLRVLLERSQIDNAELRKLAQHTLVTYDAEAAAMKAALGEKP